jgi:hypothetical protein
MATVWSAKGLADRTFYDPWGKYFLIKINKL